MPEQALGQLMYTEHLQMTSQTDFGLEMGAVLTGQAEVPPLGLRVDIAVQGEVTGPMIQGTVEGVDYLRLENDGTGRIHAHCVITTHDGARISLFADGVTQPQEGTPIYKLNQYQTLQTASPQYTWVNSKRFWAIGEANVQTGEIVLECYGMAEEMATS